MSMTSEAVLGRKARWTNIRRETGRALAAALIALGVAFIIILFTSRRPSKPSTCC